MNRSIASPREASPRRQTSWWALLELIRLPNVFTVIADVSMAYLFWHPSLEPIPTFALLVVASCLLYWAGMVLNDYFDRAIDALERPARPIPSGRISASAASRIGWAMMAAGILAACAASYLSGQFVVAILSVLLAATIVAYDAWAKHHAIGPWMMGACRLWNILMGMCAAVAITNVASWCVAGGVGIYIAGVTLLAKTESDRSRRGGLLAGVFTMAAGLLLLTAFPLDATVREGASPALQLSSWWILMAALSGSILWRAVVAIFDPSPKLVQAAVKHAILSLIMLDAAVITAVRDPVWGVAILLLLLPAMFVGRWFYST